MYKSTENMLVRALDPVDSCSLWTLDCGLSRADRGEGLWNVDCCHNTRNILFSEIITVFICACVFELHIHSQKPNRKISAQAGRKSTRTRGLIQFPLHYRLFSVLTEERSREQMTPLIWDQAFWAFSSVTFFIISFSILPRICCESIVAILIKGSLFI